MATFVERSATTGSGSTVPAHGSAVVGDKQILGVATHATVTPGTPTGGDWTQLSQTSSAHSKLTIFTRTLTAGNISGTVSVTWADFGRVEMRTYRDVNAFSVAGSGTGLVSPSRTALGILLRFVASAENNGSSFPPAKTLTSDAALLNSSPAAVYNWYDGLVAADDPTASGGTAPVRTATNTGGGDSYPQWVDVNVEEISTAERRAATTYVEASMTGAGELRAGTVYVEASTIGTGQLQAAASYVEASTTGAGILQFGTLYVEALIPAKPGFIGWGTPISS